VSIAKAVIFDVDGVLVDSYRAHFLSWQRLAGELGRVLDEEEFAVSFGRTSREIIAAWDQRFSAEEVRRFDDRKEAIYREIVRADFPAMNGVESLLESLHAAGFRLAVGSSGPPANVQLVLEQLERESLFAARVTGDDVTHGKPDPQVFLMAAERLDVPPPRCVVVEDAAPGVAAAHAAGMKCIGLASTGRTRHELARAELVVDRLDEIAPANVDELLG